MARRSITYSLDEDTIQKIKDYSAMTGQKTTSYFVESAVLKYIEALDSIPEFNKTVSELQNRLEELKHIKL